MWDKPLFKSELAKRSAVRIAVDPEFRYIMEDLARMRQRITENKISLNEKARRAEIDEDKGRKEKRTAERAKASVPEQKDYVVTLDTVAKPELTLAKTDKDKKDDADKADAADDSDDAADADDGETTNKAVAIDPVRNETLNILGDFVDLSRSPKTASTVDSAPRAPR